MNRIFWLLSFMPLVFAFQVFAAGPILVDTESTGKAVVWQSGVVHYNTESGPDATLGKLSNDEARQLVRDLFDDWATITIHDIPTVSLTIEEGEGLGSVDASNVDSHFTYCPAGENCPGEDPPFVTGSARSGQSPILFDSDGKLTDLVFGEGGHSSILGFAGPRVIERVAGELYITESQAVLNGLFIDCPDGASHSDPCQSPETDLERFKGAIFHEIGHFLGIDHTQVNLSSAIKASNGDDSEAEAIPTMLPLYIEAADQLTPHFDDKVAISVLYPSEAFQNSFCTVSGKVFEADGVTEFQGVNVVTRSKDDPLTESTSWVSGALYTGTFENCAARQGAFTIGGIFPGTDYTLEIEPISQAFTEGSSIEPCDPPASGFEADTVPGTFSCVTGGEVITTGTTANTNLVTTKQSSIASSDSGTGGGCSLIP